MKSKTPELCVIGGGAAGLAAAVEAARAFRQAGIPGGVTVLEQLPRVGKKLLATGNGRCNFATHIKTEGGKSAKVNPLKASKRAAKGR